MKKYLNLIINYAFIGVGILSFTIFFVSFIISLVQYVKGIPLTNYTIFPMVVSVFVMGILTIIYAEGR